MLPQTRKTSLALLAVVATGAYGAQNDGISLEPPLLPKVTKLSFSGVGCPPGTANATWSTANWSDWIISLHDLNLEAVSGAHGANRPPPLSTCMVHAEFSQASPGWQLALEAVSIRGYAALSSGSSLSAEVSVAWEAAAPVSKNIAAAPVAGAQAGTSASRNISLTNSRPTDEASAMGALLDFSSVPAWSECTTTTSTALGNLNLNLTFGVHVPANATGAYAAFGGLADDGYGEILASPAVVQRLQWTWRACTAPVIPVGSTTFFPKPKTTSSSVSNSTSTVAVTATAKNVTTTWTTTATPKPFPPFSNSTLSSHPVPTARPTGGSSSSATWTASKSLNETVTKTTLTTKTVTTTTTTSSTWTSASSARTTTQTTSEKTTSVVVPTMTPTTSERHWTTTTTQDSPSSYGSTFTTSMTGTSFSFSFIDDDTTTTTTTSVPTTSTAVFTAPSSSWHNSTTTSSWTNATSTYAGTNGTGAGSRVTGTIRPVPLETQK